MSRRVQERQLTVVVAHLVGTDVLGDAAGLTRDHLGLADGIQERRLAVVDVAHNRDHRRPCDEALGSVFLDRGKLVLLLGVDDLNLALEFRCDDLHLLIRQRLGDGGQLPHAHERLDDQRRRDAERFGHLFDRGAGAHVDLGHLRRRDGDGGLAVVGAVTALLSASIATLGSRSTPAGLCVDDHTAALATSGVPIRAAAGLGRRASRDASRPRR